MMFLVRVSCNNSKLNDNMLNFNDIAIFDAEDPDDEEAPTYIEGDPTNQATQNERICKFCFSQESNCTLVPCGHTYTCMSCYRRTIGLDDADGNAMPSTSEEPRNLGNCPYCSREVLMYIQSRWN